MKKVITVKEIRTVGLDLGDQWTHFCALDPQGQCVEEGKIATTQEAFRSRFAHPRPLRIALEVGAHSPWVSRLLESLGHEVLVANARKLRLIYENDRKSDAVDAQYLARLARLDPQLLYPIEHRSAKSQADLAVIRARDLVVRSRTRLISHLRGAVKSFGVFLPSGSPKAAPQKLKDQIPLELRAALSPLLTILDSLNQEIKRYDLQIEQIAQSSYPAVARLRQVYGVGPITALCFVLTLGDPRRFPNSRSVGSFLGLRPRQQKSCTLDPQLRITKAGDCMLRFLLVNCAQHLLGRFGKDCDLRRWGLAKIKQGGKNNKKRVVVAVARKLSVLLHRLWISQEDYEPLRNARLRLAQPRISA